MDRAARPGSGHSAGYTCHPDSWSTPWYPREQLVAVGRVVFFLGRVQRHPEQATGWDM